MNISIIYFNFPFWRAEVSRIALDIGKIKYNDIRIDRDEFTRARSTGQLDDGTVIPFHQLPCLIVDNESIGQTAGIARFCGKLSGLYPKDENLMSAKIYQFIDLLTDITVLIFNAGRYLEPREKIIKYGTEKLECWELVATILGSGIQWLDVFQLSKKANKVIEEQAGSITIEDLEKIKWIGKVKAIQIISAFELAKRHFIDDNIIIESIWDVLGQVSEYRNKRQEYLICITLDVASRLINKRIITIWLLNQSLVHPREVFADAIEDRAHSIILVNNHPSGTNKPSNEDIYVTKRLREVSELVWIQLRDHIIITKNDYYSFKENSLV